MNNEPQSLQVTTIANPWAPHSSRKVLLQIWRDGLNVAECATSVGLAAIGAGDGLELRCGMNGKCLDRETWPQTTVKPGDSLVFAAVPLGGGGGGGGKNVVKMIAMIALMVVVSIVTFGVGSVLAGGGWAWGMGLGGVSAFSWAGAGALAAGMAVGIGGSLLINAIMPAPKMELASNSLNWADASQTYGWDITRNLNREGLLLPVLFGTMLLTPPTVNAYVRIDGNGDQFLNAIFAVAEGPIELKADAAYGNLPAVYVNGKHYSEYTKTYMPPAGEADLLEGGTASASSYNSTLYPALACDNNYSIESRWGATGMGTWWKYDFGAGRKITVTRYSLYTTPGDLASRYSPTDWVFAGSNDNSTWTTLDSQSGQVANAGEQRYYSISNSTGYRYYRLTINATTGNSSVVIVEIEFYGSVEEGQLRQTVNVEFMPGLNTQPVLSGINWTYAGAASFTPARVTTDWVTSETEGTAATVIGVGFSFPGGLYQVDTAGNVQADAVQISIEHRRETSPGTWEESWTAWDAWTITAAQNSAWAQYKEKAGLTAGKYQVRVKFTAAPTNSPRFVNQCWWNLLQTAVEDEFTYPNTALLGLRALATDQFSGGMPRVQLLATRSTVAVRTSAPGVTEVWADLPATNPAWAAYDMLVNERYGAGVDPDEMLYAEFADWADFCDDEGLTVNICFDAAAGLAAAINDLAIAGRAAVVQKGGRYGVIVDRAASPVQMFTMGNIAKDTFKLDYLDLQNRANVVEVTYFDADRDYQRTVIEVRDSTFDASTEGERNSPAVVLYGCTSRDQAVKYGRFMLRQNKYIRRTITFDVGIDAIACVPGDVILFSHDVPQWGFSGRLISYNAGLVQVTLDREVTLEYGVSYEIQARNQLTDVIETKTIVNTATAGLPVTSAVLTLASAFANDPGADAVFAFGIVTAATKQYRVLSITRGQDQNRKITAAEYNAAVYTDTEATPALPTVSQLPGVTALTAAEIVSGDLSQASLAWQGVASRWTVLVDTWDGADWVFDQLIETAASSLLLPVIKGVRYQFTVSSAMPISSAVTTLDVINDKTWDFAVTCRRTFSDSRPQTDLPAKFGWRNIRHTDASLNIAPDPGTFYDPSSGGSFSVPLFHIVSWPFKAGSHSWTMHNDGSSQITAASLLTGFNTINMDGRTLYVTITDQGGGYFSISIYKDSGRTQLVAHTANYNSTGNKTVIADNASGLAGTLAVGAVGPADNDIYLTVATTWTWSSTQYDIASWQEDYRYCGDRMPIYLAVLPGSNISAQALIWDASLVPLASGGLNIVEVDPFDFEPLAAVTDMTAVGTLTATPSTTEVKFYRVTFGGEEVQQTVTVVNGWNAIGLSVFPSNPSFKRLFPGAQGYYGYAYPHDGNPVASYHCEPIHGIMAYFTAGASIVISGIPLISGTKILLETGWNFIAIADDMPLPNGVDENRVWESSGEAFISHDGDLEAATAYWIYCLHPVVIYSKLP